MSATRATWIRQKNRCSRPWTDGGGSSIRRKTTGGGGAPTTGALGVTAARRLDTDFIFYPPIPNAPSLESSSSSSSLSSSSTIATRTCHSIAIVELILLIVQRTNRIAVLVQVHCGCAFLPSIDKFRRVFLGHKRRMRRSPGDGRHCWATPLICSFASRINWDGDTIEDGGASTGVRYYGDGDEEIAVHMFCRLE